MSKLLQNPVLARNFESKKLERQQSKSRSRSCSACSHESTGHETGVSASGLAKLDLNLETSNETIAASQSFEHVADQEGLKFRVVANAEDIRDEKQNAISHLAEQLESAEKKLEEKDVVIATLQATNRKLKSHVQLLDKHLRQAEVATEKTNNQLIVSESQLGSILSRNAALEMHVKALELREQENAVANSDALTLLQTRLAHQQVEIEETWSKLAQSKKDQSELSLELQAMTSRYLTAESNPKPSDEAVSSMNFKCQQTLFNEIKELQVQNQELRHSIQHNHTAMDDLESENIGLHQKLTRYDIERQMNIKQIERLRKLEQLHSESIQKLGINLQAALDRQCELETQLRLQTEASATLSQRLGETNEILANEITEGAAIIVDKMALQKQTLYLEKQVQFDAKEIQNLKQALETSEKRLREAEKSLKSAEKKFVQSEEALRVCENENRRLKDPTLRDLNQRLDNESKYSKLKNLQAISIGNIKGDSTSNFLHLLRDDSNSKMQELKYQLFEATRHASDLEKQLTELYQTRLSLALQCASLRMEADKHRAHADIVSTSLELERSNDIKNIEKANASTESAEKTLVPSSGNNLKTAYKDAKNTIKTLMSELEQSKETNQNLEYMIRGLEAQLQSASNRTIIFTRLLENERESITTLRKNAILINNQFLSVAENYTILQGSLDEEAEEAERVRRRGVIYGFQINEGLEALDQILHK